MGKPTIKILDPIHSKVSREARELILPCLEYQEIYWKRSFFKKRKAEYKKSHLITGNKNSGGTILTGLIDRVINFANQSGFFVSVDSENLEIVDPTRKLPKLKNIIFREDQLDALKAIQKLSRGIIKFPTGSGKTIIALGLFSMFEKSPTLFLCHTKDLLMQTKESLNLLPKKRNVFILGGGNEKILIKTIRREKAPIVISTVQTFSKYSYKEWCDFFDITIVDECHRVNSKTSQYGKIMEYNLAPIRIGLSATPPTKGKEGLICEGFFGPIISELRMDEGIEKKIIAKPIINLVPVPLDKIISTKAGRNYREVYSLGIIQNEARNGLIVNLVQESLKRKEIVLIVIENTEHGKILRKLLKQEGINAPFVWGDTNKETRERTKKRLKSGRLSVAICSKIWREGVNIPSLNHIINAHGMKEEKIIIQAMGRGLRIHKNKTEIKLSDFLDPYNYLAQHAILRIQIYRDQGWL